MVARLMRWNGEVVQEWQVTDHYDKEAIAKEMYWRYFGDTTKQLQPKTVIYGGMVKLGDFTVSFRQT